MAQTLSVSQITAQIKRLFDEHPDMADVWISGEVSSWKQVESGHCYFTLKDADSQLKCVMWRASADRQARFGGLPRSGDSIEAHGSISVYESGGAYQLYVDKLIPAGLGVLYQEYERLKSELSDEGLFDPARKRSLPTVIRRIGIVTSPDGAVFRDVQHVLARRYPLAELMIAPTPVQGDDAPPQIVKALARLNARDDVDVILVCRGGGSMEDLWCFNDERVVRAVAASRLPVVSGVGHETDTTLTDFAADVRAPTPSAAAEMVTPDVAELRVQLRQAQRQLRESAIYALDARQYEVNHLTQTLQRLSPQVRVNGLRQRLDDFDKRLAQSARDGLRVRQAGLKTAQVALRAVDPRAILAKGYAIITLSDGTRRVTAVKDAPPGTAITIQLADGDLYARVEDKDTHGRYPRTLF
jgi:exodeoxyribonuclease VII large subunit